MIYNQQLEGQVLSGLINTPEAYPEIASYLNTEDFFHEINATIYTLIRNALNNRETLDKVILIGKLRELSIAFKDNIDPSSYIESLALNKVSGKVLIQSVKELKITSKRRDYCDMSKQIVSKMKKATNMKYEEIVTFVDELVHNQMNNWVSENEIIDLFDGLYELTEERGNNPVEEVGIAAPYPEFNRLYGGFKSGDVYLFCSRMGEGKSTLLTNTAFKMANMGDNKIPCLVIDTEMGQNEAVDVKFRLMASLTGIDPWYFESGNWRKDPVMTKVIREHKVDGKTLYERISEYKLYYRYLVDASTHNIISTIKKWYYTTVGRGNQCIIVYDYIKIADGDMSHKAMEWQVLGQKIDKLKQLVGDEVNAPLLTAAQLNKLGDNRKGDQHDTSSAIAGSDSLLRFASFGAIFRQKTLNEISEETTAYGTHKLIPLKTRHQGKNSSGHNRFIKKPDGKITDNFINFSLDSFNVKEIGGAEQMYEELPNIARTGDLKLPTKKEIKEKNTPAKDNPFD